MFSSQLCRLLALASDDNRDIIFVTTSKSQDLEPTVPQEYILKGVVNAAVGQVISEYEDYQGDCDDEVGLYCLINEGWSN